MNLSGYRLRSGGPFPVWLSFRCLKGQAPQYLTELVWSNSDLGYVKTPGCGKMHLETVKTSGIESHFHLKLPRRATALLVAVATGCNSLVVHSAS